MSESAVLRHGLKRIHQTSQRSPSRKKLIGLQEIKPLRRWTACLDTLAVGFPKRLREMFWTADWRIKNDNYLLLLLRSHNHRCSRSHASCCTHSDDIFFLAACFHSSDYLAGDNLSDDSHNQPINHLGNIDCPSRGLRKTVACWSGCDSWGEWAAVK